MGAAIRCGVVALLLASASSNSACGGSGRRSAAVGLYFEDVTFASAALGGPLRPEHLPDVRAAARAEVVRAFKGLRVSVSGRRDARYRVAVVQQLRDRRQRAAMFVAGESRAVAGFGGIGAVNFSLLASAAVSCAPAGATVETLVAAIGRGVGRAAAHEFAHQLLPTTMIHATRDVRSYEYYAASRCEQYFGDMHWDQAGPLLRARFGG